MEEPENLDFQDFLILGTPGNLYLRIWIYQITFKNLRSPGSISQQYYFGNLEIWNV